MATSSCLAVSLFWYPCLSLMCTNGNLPSTRGLHRVHICSLALRLYATINSVVKRLNQLR
jgi:hypothetical protein